MTEPKRILFSAGEAAGVIGAACRGNLEAPIRAVVVDSRRLIPTPSSCSPGRKGGWARFHGRRFVGARKWSWAAGGQKEKALGLSPFRPFRGPASFSPIPPAVFQACEGYRRRSRPVARCDRFLGQDHTKNARRSLQALLSLGAVPMNEGNLDSDIGLPCRCSTSTKPCLAF